MAFDGVLLLPASLSLMLVVVVCLFVYRNDLLDVDVVDDDETTMRGGRRQEGNFE